jgi:hypothetical protein
VAVVAPDRPPLRLIVPTPEIGLTCRYLLAQHPQAHLVIGDSTSSRDVCELLRQVLPATTPQPVAEKLSTLEGRELYWQDHPPRGLQRLLPRGMRVPPRPVDDYAALVLARRYLASLENETARPD